MSKRTRLRPRAEEYVKNHFRHTTYEGAQIIEALLEEEMEVEDELSSCQSELLEKPCEDGEGVEGPWQ